MRQGKLVKKGCAVDASIISSASRPTKQVNIDVVAEDRQEEDTPPPAVTVSYSKDVDASWTKKGQRYYYGYKIHVATDITDGFVLAGHATASHKSDTGEFASVIDATSLHQKTRVYADKGYTSEKNRKILQERGLKDGIMNKAVRGRKLTLREQRRNRLISGLRGIIERGFGTLKRVYGLARASYRGLAKVEGEFLLCAMAFNLKKSSIFSITIGYLRPKSQITGREYWKKAQLLSITTENSRNNPLVMDGRYFSVLCKGLILLITMPNVSVADSYNYVICPFKVGLLS